MYRAARKMKDTHKSLPIEIQFVILLRLPVKSLVRFRCVSKPWLAEITSQRFIKLYQQTQSQSRPQNSDGSNSLLLVSKSKIFTYGFSGAHFVCEIPRPPNFFPDTKYHIAGSCNGVLCLVDPTFENIALYNPTTRAYRVVPDLKLEKSRIPGSHSYLMRNIWFGYDHESNDFKILQLALSGAYVYRLRNDSEDVTKFRRSHISPPKTHKVVSNNAAHWLLDTGIIAFDFRTEELHRVPLPGGVVTRPDEYSNVTVLRGCLHIATCKFKDRLTRYCLESLVSMEIWIMKEYGVRKSWTKLLHYSSDEFRNLFVLNFSHPIKYTGQLRPKVYAYSSNQQKILVGVEVHPKNFFSCDLQTRKVEKVEELCNLPDGDEDGFYVAPWTCSFALS